VVGFLKNLFGNGEPAQKEHRLSIEENDWTREIEEGGVLLGTEILGFEREDLDTTSPPTPLLAKERGEEREKQIERRKELERMKIRLEELGGAGGAEVTKEYRETLERDEFLTKELEDLKKSAESLELLIKDLLQKLDEEFKDGIEKINKTFQEFFSLMFGGGKAQLEVIKEKIKKKRDLLDLEYEGEPLPLSREDLENGVTNKETKDG